MRVRLGSRCDFAPAAVGVPFDCAQIHGRTARWGPATLQLRQASRAPDLQWLGRLTTESSMPAHVFRGTHECEQAVQWLTFRHVRSHWLLKNWVAPTPIPNSHHQAGHNHGALM